MDEKLPETVDEAIQWMLNKLDLQNRKLLKAMKREDLWSLHHGYGTGIRNSLGLWGSNSALRNAPELKSMLSPDDISTYLIERLWEYLQGIDLETSDGDEKSP